MSNGGAYTTIASWDDGDDVWHYNTVTVDKQHLGTETTFRFSADLSGLDLSGLFGGGTERAIAVDNVSVSVTQDDSAGPDLVMYGVSASHGTVDSGDAVKVRYSVKNAGTETAGKETVSVYRHLSKTSTPETGGKTVSTYTMRTSLAPGSGFGRAANIKTLSVSEDTVVHYYVCISGAEGETDTDNNCDRVSVTVKAEEIPEPAEEPVATPTETETGVTVRSVTASPTTVTAGGTVTVRISIRNNGTETVSDKAVQVYRHTSRANPKQGALISTETSGTISANAAKTLTVTDTAPTVTSQTTYYYHACVDDSCAVSARVSARPEEPARNTITGPVGSYADAPYEHCDHSPSRKYVMGGDAILIESIDEPEWVFNCGTLTLGGLETADGTRGFVISGHIAVDNYGKFFGDPTKTNAVVGHGTFFSSGNIGILLGKVFAVPDLSKGSIEGEPLIHADAAFVAYPSLATANCSLTWKNLSKTYCLDVGQGDQVERVTPLTIRGKNGRAYTVIGSQMPEKDMEVWISGAVSGVVEGNRTSGKKMLTLDYSEFAKNGDVYVFVYTIPVKPNLPTTTGGDSGSPVYTVPDAEGNVRIVGVHKGKTTTSDEIYVMIFSPWHSVTKEFDLKPIERETD